MKKPPEGGSVQQSPARRSGLLGSSEAVTDTDFVARRRLTGHAAERDHASGADCEGGHWRGRANHEVGSAVVCNARVGSVQSRALGEVVDIAKRQLLGRGALSRLRA